MQLTGKINCPVSVVQSEIGENNWTFWWEIISCSVETITSKNNKNSYSRTKMLFLLRNPSHSISLWCYCICTLPIIMVSKWFFLSSHCSSVWLFFFFFFFFFSSLFIHSYFVSCKNVLQLAYWIICVIGSL